MIKPAKFRPDSRWVRYDKTTQLWIPNRKRIYLYWYKFLQLALVDGFTPVRWGAYKGWGKPADILSKPFDAWWDEVRPLMINENASLDAGKPFVEQFEKQKKEKENGIPDWTPPQIDKNKDR